MKPLRACLVCLAVLLFFAHAAAGALAASAYVADGFPGLVSVIDTTTNATNPIPIKVGFDPFAIAITPDGRTAYVVDNGSSAVSAIDTATNTASQTLIPVGHQPIAIAITPDGKTAYVANFGSNNVSVIDTATNTPSLTVIPVGASPEGIAITPDGRTVYVTNRRSNSVSVIDTATNTASPTPIKVGAEPAEIAITPDGKTAYVTDFGSESVSVIDTATNTASPTPIAVGATPFAIAITPDGKTAYVANSQSNNVSVIDTATNTASPTPIPVGIQPAAIAITPDGKTAYVTDFGSASVSVIDTATNTASPTSIAVGEDPSGIAIAPDQPPAAAFSAPRARPGVPLALDASASKDPDSPISSYAWSFGDGQNATVATPQATHVFARPGTYTVSLKEADTEGCSTTGALAFTGQTAAGCNGNGAAQATKTITVAYPGVEVKCPRNAGRRGCAFKLQAVAGKPKRGGAPKAETAIGRASAKAGHSAIVSLKPTKAFAKKLAVARTVLVKETVTANGASKSRFARLRIVQ